MRNKNNTTNKGNGNKYIKIFSELRRTKEKILKYRDIELEKMNYKKVGRPYTYTHSEILLSLIMYKLFFPSLRGVHAYLLIYERLEYVPNFRTISDRAKNIEIKEMARFICGEINNLKRERYIAIAIDSTGFSHYANNSWFEEKHKVKGKRVWSKVEIIVDVENRDVVYYEIYPDSRINEAEHSRFRRKIEELLAMGYDVKVVYADSLYDSYDNFQFLENKGILPVIKIRSSSVKKASSLYSRYLIHGDDKFKYRVKHLARDYYALEQSDWDKYKSRYRYGNREIVESVFSVIKRVFGDVLRFRREESRHKEIEIMILLYNWLLNDKDEGERSDCGARR